MQDRFRFRAWDTEEDRYVSDDDICFDTGGSCDSVYDLLKQDDRFYIYEQCTGLKDINGKLIYEGDILKVVSAKYHTYSYQCVDYCNTVCAYWFHRAGYMGVLSEDSTFEIVGNIHENPELLEGKNG